MTAGLVTKMTEFKGLARDSQLKGEMKYTRKPAYAPISLNCQPPKLAFLFLVIARRPLPFVEGSRSTRGTTYRPYVYSAFSISAA